MRLAEAGAGILRADEVEIPEPGPGEVLLRVRACGVCRTDQHIVDGELPVARLPLVPGHEIVGDVVRLGPQAAGVAVGTRVGVPWLARTCGQCRFCTTGRENLCASAAFTGYSRDGGYAEWVTADAGFVFPLPEGVDDVACAPWLCAGLIGHRAYRMAGEGRRLGIYGFGAAGHIVAQVAAHEGREVFAFTRPGDLAAQRLARDLGAVWAGGTDETPPALLDAALIFASHGPLVPQALAQIERGGTVVCAGIHMTDIPSFPYQRLWGERVIRSVANLTRQDARAFLALAPQVPVRTRTERYALAEANRALDDLRAGRLSGAAVLVP
ncbi:MAG TPA: zinc-dependent alcohol dehydrogenase family protein [Polyangia bacterium]